MPMRAHYSNNHRGYCVEYDMEQGENQSLKGLVFPVQYSDRRIDLTDFFREQVRALLEERDRCLEMGKEVVAIDDPHPNLSFNC